MLQTAYTIYTEYYSNTRRLTKRPLISESKKELEKNREGEPHERNNWF